MCTQTFCEMSKVFLLLSECNCHRIHDRTNKRAVIYYIRCSNFQLFHRIRSLGFLSAALSSHPFLLNLSFLLLFKFIFCTQELCSARSSFFSKWNEIAFISLHVCWPELFCVTYRLNQLCFQSIFPVFSDRSLCPAIAEVVLILWEASYSDLYSLCPSNWLHQKWIANLHSFFLLFNIAAIADQMLLIFDPYCLNDFPISAIKGRWKMENIRVSQQRTVATTETINIQIISK